MIEKQPVEILDRHNNRKTARFQHNPGLKRPLSAIDEEEKPITITR